jgi:hypothetical protein
MALNPPKIGIPLLAALLLAATACCAAEPPVEVRLVEDGRAAAVVVLPPSAPVPVRYAAEELVAHIREMTGTTLEIVDALSEPGPAIVLGDSELIRSAGVEVEAIPRDGYVILTVGDRICVAGRDGRGAKARILGELNGPDAAAALDQHDNRFTHQAGWAFERGTLQGVYRLLEEFGCRWFYPGPAGTVIPRKQSLAAGALEIREQPDWKLRFIWPPRWDGMFHDRVRRKDELEAMGWTNLAVRKWLLRNRAGSYWLAFNHRPVSTRWEGRFAESHPEYFALRQNGYRDIPPQTSRLGHLCYTSEDVYRQTLSDIDAFFGRKGTAVVGLQRWNPKAAYEDTFSLLPDDSFFGCWTAGCRAKINDRLSYDRRHSRLVWEFVERVARRAQTMYPEATLTCLGYASYTYPPPTVESLPENLLVGLCPIHINRPYNTLDEEGMGKLRDLVAQWRKRTDRPMLFWLHHLYRYFNPDRPHVPMVLPHHLGRLIRELGEDGEHMFFQQDFDAPALENLNRYLVQRLLYDSSQDVDALIEEYCRGLYGPAAPLVQQFYAELESRCEAIGRNHARIREVWDDHLDQQAVDGWVRTAERVVELNRGTGREAAARIFRDYVVGSIRLGREHYVREIQDLLASDAARILAPPVEGDIEIDGALDEPAWAAAEDKPLLSNRDGEPISWKTTARVAYDEEFIYVAFDCTDPQAAKLPDRGPDRLGNVDSVEVFLDPTRDSEDYYFLQVSPVTGLRIGWHVRGEDQPIDDAWGRDAQIASQILEDRWTVEIAIPRAAMLGGDATAADAPWGANFCRTITSPARREDQYSTTSPAIRGSFHQPDLFARLYLLNVETE